MGLLDRCLDEGWGTTEFRVCDVDGGLLQAFTMPQLVGADYPGMLGIMRPTLHSVLLDAAHEEGVRIRAGLGLVGLTQSGEKVEATLSDGSGESFDLLVGADGCYSTVRELLFGDLPLEFHSQACLRAVIPRPEAVDAEYVFEGHETAQPGFTPLADDKMYVFCVLS